MENLPLKTSREVEKVYQGYPDCVRTQMKQLRKLIIDTAKEMEEITQLEESLKWGEPSFITPIGSTIRIDWKEKQPDFYAIYFSCTSKLIPTFRLVYKDIFSFEGSRAIQFKLDEKIQKTALKKCITAALQYHKVKHLFNLGM
ncbi:DUF1801 domain-containing protein [Mesonia aquimarina]|uniref:DUF1801 domain-containing protein n=1 Tax=Mesonia aquimarina TaxID=1504967 RepID=UPI000EF58EB0|nr:DUF1801 domain-containing protein [Mesonia aquimarina]